MATHRALVLESRDKPLVLKQKQMPEAIAGSAVIKVLANAISPNAKRVLAGEFHTPLSTPTTPSAGAIGRIHAVGPDAVSLQEGQLVVTDFCISARDNPNVQILQGYMGFHPILDSHWSDGTYAEYARVPLERCWSLNEKRFTQELGYSLADLAFLPTIAVPHGGLQEIQIQAGDTVIVAPATGYFGGAAVHAAIACGARVIAAGRNTAVLSKLESVFGSAGRIKTVTFSGDVKADTKALIEASGSSAGADKYIDFSPPQSSGSKHVTSCIEALRPFGRCVLMGLVYGGVEIPYASVGLKCIRIQGRFMFDYVHAQQTIRLAETGMLKLGSGDQSGVKVQSFKLDDFQRALDQAEKDSSWGNMIVLEP